MDLWHRDIVYVEKPILSVEHIHYSDSKEIQIHALLSTPISSLIPNKFPEKKRNIINKINKAS